MNLKISKQKYFCLFTIIYLIWPLYFYIGSVNGANILLLLFIGSWIVINNMKIRRIEISSFLSYIIAFWIISRLIVYLYHSENTRAVMLILSTVFWGMITVDCIQYKEDFFSIIDILINVGFVISCFGIFEAITDINVFSYFNNSNIELNYNAARMGRIRILSFTGQTINYCLLCGILALLVFYRINTTEISKDKRKYFFVTYVLLIINMLLTLSRSSIIVFIGAQLLMLNKLGLKKFVQYIVIGFTVLILSMIIYNFLFRGENMLIQIIYMLLAVFDNSFGEKLVGWSSTQDTSGVADRLVLYKWVWEKAKQHLIFGMGEKAGFSYNINQTDGIYSWIFTKTSIEVNHLNLIYHYGIISAMAELLMYIISSAKAFIHSQIKQLSEENKLNFNYTIFVIILMDLISWFAVNAGSEEKFLFVLFFIWVCYNKILVSEED